MEFTMKINVLFGELNDHIKSVIVFSLVKHESWLCII